MHSACRSRSAHRVCSPIYKYPRRIGARRRVFSPEIPVNIAKFSANKAQSRRNFEFAATIRSISDCSLSVEPSSPCSAESFDFKCLLFHRERPYRCQKRFQRRSRLLIVRIDRMTSVAPYTSVTRSFFSPFIECLNLSTEKWLGDDDLCSPVSPRCSQFQGPSGFSHSRISQLLRFEAIQGFKVLEIYQFTIFTRFTIFHTSKFSIF